MLLVLLLVLPFPPKHLLQQLLYQVHVHMHSLQQPVAMMPAAAVMSLKGKAQMALTHLQYRTA